ncbi:Ig-like domain-containing protein [Microbacterium sp. Leaf320]|uniref:Ig-like domain-containing protein n=1 Tax=Microbacterium sp. Leaf320 TaxID=1736334 RepID=UPI0006FB89A4|nr:Ig-like domain-containing protein [Microbacterium sp. Leaf320]KQQ65376.1 hypothetical protein ASF63_15685 [Microbacterium sp. Leaf320]
MTARPRTHPRRRITALASSLALGTVILGVCAPSGAWAAPVPGAITGIRVVDAQAAPFAPVKVELEWTVPDTAHTGDTFTVAMPGQLTPLTAGFALTDAQGVKVADAVVTGATITFTLTDWVDTHADVSGAAFFDATFYTDQAPGVDVPVAFTADGTPFQDVVRVLSVDEVDRTKPQLAGYWTDPADQGTVSPTGAISWSLQTPLGPLPSVVLSATPGPGQSLACDKPIRVERTETYQAGTGWLTNLTPVPAGDYSVDCDSTSIRVTLHRAAGDHEIIAVTYATNVDDPSAQTYQGEGTIHVGDDPRAAHSSVTRANAGGDGTGAVPAPPTSPAPPAAEVPPVPTTPDTTDTPPVVSVDSAPQGQAATSSPSALAATGGTLGAGALAGTLLMLSGLVFAARAPRRALRRTR